MTALQSTGEANPARVRLLTDPWTGGMTGWLVVFGAVLAELAAGAITNRMSTTVAATALAVPVAVAIGFAIAQWWQSRAGDVEPASWWHLTGPAAAVFVWLSWPTMPGILALGRSTQDVCHTLPAASAAGCLRSAAYAVAGHSLSWWSAAALIVAAAALTRRSRIAAWAAIPAAFASCELATHFLQVFLGQYNFG